MRRSRLLTDALPFAVGVAALLRSVPACGQILETETARPVGQRVWEVSTNFEYQTSSEGTELALPLAMEYGITDRLELLAEPVPYTAIRPKTGPRATGGGDLEVTATYLLRRETRGVPAVAFAGEIKFPTARNSLIGTGKTDYTGYLIGSKTFGRADIHANVGYTIVGKPAGASLNNIWNFALGWEYRLNSANELFGEALANTAAASSPEPVPGSPPTSPEAPGGEVVGSIGLAHYILRTFRLSIGVSADNNGAVLFRPGFTVRTR
jgi:hypothetical protein